MLLRPEQPSDEEIIVQITRAAFANHRFGNHTEHFIIPALRAANALTLSLVAEDHGKVVGHVAFSPVTVSDGSKGWYGLGPVSVVTERQRQGIGSLLIREGLTRLREIGAKGCVLLGSPAYYSRFGFVHRPEFVLEGVPPEYFLVLSFSESSAQGMVYFHEAFQATE